MPSAPQGMETDHSKTIITKHQGGCCQLSESKGNQLPSPMGILKVVHRKPLTRSPKAELPLSLPPLSRAGASGLCEVAGAEMSEDT